MVDLQCLVNVASSNRIIMADVSFNECFADLLGVHRVLLAVHSVIIAPLGGLSTSLLGLFAIECDEVAVVDSVGQVEALEELEILDFSRGCGLGFESSVDVAE